MDDKGKDLAKQFARNIKDHQCRNDYGGTYQQNRASLKEVIFCRAFTGAGLYILPSGQKSKHFEKAIEKWATA